MRDEQAIELAVPERWKVNSATLNIYYTVSTSLLSHLSQMVIRLNGIPIGQAKLNPITPSSALKIALPTKLLEPGYNKLTFQVDQHRQEKECELPCATDLWTSIKLDSSSLDIDYDLKPIPLRLSSLTDMVFDPRITPSSTVHLAFDTADEKAAGLAAVVASGVARRFDYRRVDFTVSDTLEAGRDNVVIGTTAFVTKLLGRAPPQKPGDKGGFLKILPMAKSDGSPDPAHALVLVTGNSFDEVKLAAETLSNLSIGYPGSDELKATGFSLPDITAYGGRNILAADKLYDFKTLNQPTLTMAGMNPQPMSLNFRLPADFMIKQNRNVEIALNFAYGAGMRNDSSLNLLVNNRAVRAIPLHNPDGGVFENYKLEIPTYVFRPGDNTITFSPELHISSKECEAVQTGHMFLTIFENSTLKFPYMPHFVDMPRLELFMLNGFPFTRWPDGFEGTVYVARPTLDTLSATMNLIGMMTQKNGFPLINLSLTYQKPKAWNGDLIVVGDLFSLPDEYAAAAPLRVGKVSRVPYPVVRSWQQEAIYSFSDQSSRLGDDRGLLMEFESPLQAGRSVLLLAAEDQNDLLALSQKLLDPEVQSQVNGGLVLIDFSGAKTKVTSLSAGKRYTTGKQGDVNIVDTAADRLDSLMYAYSPVFYALLAAIIGGLTWILVALIRRYRVQRLKTVHGKGDK
ncbi:MAG TPA: cellulose biosynthesis cyclic di-GMP-binding regulatory protein BcsB [Rhodocyclaceae bacterium]